MYRDYVAWPLGWLEICASDKGIQSISMVNKNNQSNTNSHTKQASEQFRAYLCGDLKQFDLDLDVAGTPFQKQVWQALSEIPYGQTRSYQEIANHIGNPKGVRAVGLANGKNPIAIVVPCHRVIGKDGSLTGYAGGLSAKQHLLTLEGALTQCLDLEPM